MSCGLGSAGECEGWGWGAGSLIGSLLQGPRRVALLLSGPVLCGIHRHLPGYEGPAGTEEQGQHGVECSHSILKEKCADETLVSFLSSAGWDSAQPGEGPSLSPAVVHPGPSSTAAAVLDPSISAKAGGGGGDREKRGLLHVSG